MRQAFSVEDIEMIKAFVEESWDFLQKIEAGTLLIEKSSDITDFVNDTLRKIHTIKGLSSFFGFADITRISHQLESLLESIRSDKLKPSSQVVHLLLSAGDALTEFIGQVRGACEVAATGDQIIVELSSSSEIKGLIAEMHELLQSRVINDALVSPSKSPDISKDEEHLKLIKEQVTGFVVDGFLEEAGEHLSVITNVLLISLDKGPRDYDTLADLFRRVHTLKGNLGLLLSVQPEGSLLSPVIKKVIELFQDIESLLELIRAQKTAVHQAVVSLCFRCMDALQKLMDMVNDREKMSEEELNQVLSEVETVQKDLSSMNYSPSQLPSAENSFAGQNAGKLAWADSTKISRNPHIRVSEDKINRLMNVIGELVVTKNAFSEIARKLLILNNLPGLSREMKEMGQWVTRISNELENAVMSMRMTEVRQVFQKFPRIVRDIALKSDKNITLITKGEDTEIDKTIIEQISDPLLHLVRNSADHGIESVERRTMAGKDPRGTVWLRAYNQGKYVIIEVEDDGKGMDAEVLKAKAVKRGFITQDQAEEMSEAQALNLIFLPGFSTAANVSEISGRGVGMDVVHNNITAIRGIIELSSTVGKGSKVTMKLPLTLAVSRGLLVGVGKERMFLPLDNVIETLKVSVHKMALRKGRTVLFHRNEVLGVVALSKLMGMPDKAESTQTLSIVVLGDGTNKVAVIVDNLINEQEVLIKSLDETLSNIPGTGGATIMGDGKIALVLNPVELIKMATGQIKT